MHAQATAFRRTDAWRKGKKGQRIVSDFLQDDDWHVIDNADSCGEDGDKAPRLHGRDDNYITPDLLICKGRSCWLEVKTKEKPTVHRKTGRIEHGFSLRHYRDYLAVQKLTGLDVWVAVYELNSRKLLFGRLEDLARNSREYDGDVMDVGGTIFFLRSDFEPYHRTELSKN